MADNVSVYKTKFTADTKDYVSDVDKAKNANNDLDESSQDAGGSVSKMGGFFSTTKGKIVGATAAIGAAVVAIDSVNTSIITNAINTAKWQSELGGTEAETQKVAQANAELANSYLLPQKELNRISGLNATYIKDADQLIQANELVAQTAILYAAKEGDLSLAADQAVTSQEALRDVILTGSTTAFEDAGISLSEYSNQIIKATGFTDAQVASITAGTNGTFEYTEALSKAASPQERFQALAATTNKTFEDLSAQLPESAKRAIEYQRAIFQIQKTLTKVIQSVVLAIDAFGAWVSNLSQTIAASAAFQSVVTAIQNVIAFLTPIVQRLVTAFQNAIPVIVNIVNVVGQALVPVFNALKPVLSVIIQIVITLVTALINLWNAIAPLIIPIIVKLGAILGQLVIALAPVLTAIGQLIRALINFLAPVLQIVITVILSLVDILITVFGPILVVVANILSAVLAVAINVIITLINTLTPIVTLIATAFSNLGSIIQTILAAAFAALEIAITPINKLFQLLGGFANDLSRRFNVLVQAIQAKLAPAFDVLNDPLEGLINLFKSFIDLVNRATDAVSNFANIAVDKFNSIPFLPDVGGGSRSAFVSALPAGSSSTINRNVQTTFNVQQTGQLTKLDVLRLERGLMT